MTNIRIDHTVKKPVATDLYGLFFEDINRAGDGGLYPEMLRNRSFEDSIVPAGCTASEDGAVFVTKNGFTEPFCHGEGDPAWAARIPYTAVPGWYADNARMTVVTDDTLNKHRTAALRVTFSAGGSIRNTGFHCIPAEKGKASLFCAFWKAENPVALKISIVGKDHTILASGTCEVPAGSYGRSDLILIPSDTDYESCIEITSVENADITIGFTSLMPQDTYKGHGLRTDLVSLLAKTHSRFLRWPGGCVVEGFNKESSMRFVYSVGPVWERTSTWDLWHYRSTNGFGFHEFLQLCEDLNMEALYVINVGISCQVRCPEFFDETETAEMLDDCLMALEYALGNADTRWGALRSQMGHPEPFALKYIEIGNENDGAEYDKRYLLFLNRLKELYPDIVLISNAHTERRGLPTEYVDEHYYFDWQFFAQSGHLYDHYPGNGAKVFLGEYAVTRGEDVGNLHSALSETCFLLGLERNPEVVRLAAFAPLFENVLYKQWNPNLISFDNHRASGLPLLSALGMLGESRGTELLNAVSDTQMTAPLKYGFVGVLSYRAGMRMLKPIVNGAVAEVCKEPAGHWITRGNELISDCTGNDKLESITRFPIQLTLTNGLFSSHAQNENEITARVFMDENTPEFAITFWVHNTTEPGVTDMFPNPDAPAGAVSPKQVYALGDTEYYTWTIDNGQGRNLFLYRYQEHPITAPVNLPIRWGEYNDFTVKTSGTGFDCYLNGTFVCHGEDRKFGRIETVATCDDEYLYIKLLNNTSQDEPARIYCGIPVRPVYSWSQISGDPKATNTLDAPDTISTVRGTGRLDGETIMWNAGKYSFTILKLKKA